MRLSEVPPFNGAAITSGLTPELHRVSSGRRFAVTVTEALEWHQDDAAALAAAARILAAAGRLEEALAAALSSEVASRVAAKLAQVPCGAGRRQPR
jgi:hypothetical protein